MTDHPASQPMLVALLDEPDRVVRARLLLAMPHDLIVDNSHALICHVNQKRWPAAYDYITCVMCCGKAKRDQYGHLPRPLAEQLNAARLTLCVEAGSVAMEPRPQI